ncbi:hypothetical protein RQP46_010219 [Phenoliferia psychrophenolica]
MLRLSPSRALPRLLQLRNPTPVSRLASQYSTTAPPAPAPKSRLPALVAIASVSGVLGAGVYSQFPTHTVAPILTEEETQRARIAHWKIWKAKRDAIEEKHATLAAKELRDLERDHPGALERRKECEARRAADKVHEMKLMHDRHLMTEPGMKTGKIPGWEDKQKARREHMHLFDEEMSALERRLDEEDARKGQ